MNAAAFAAFIEQLNAGPASVRQLVKHTGLHENSIRKYLTALHHRNQARITEWVRSPTWRFEALWEMGEGPHAPRPKTTPEDRRQRSNQTRRLAYLHRKLTFHAPLPDLQDHQRSCPAHEDRR